MPWVSQGVNSLKIFSQAPVTGKLRGLCWSFQQQLYTTSARSLFLHSICRGHIFEHEPFSPQCDLLLAKILSTHYGVRSVTIGSQQSQLVKPQFSSAAEQLSQTIFLYMTLTFCQTTHIFKPLFISWDVTSSEKVKVGILNLTTLHDFPARLLHPSAGHWSWAYCRHK